MTKFLKIVATIVFFMIWGSIQRGCQEGARQTAIQHGGADGTGIGYVLINLFGLALLIAGIVGIWKYNPKKGKNDDNQKLDKS